jgi:hypothetical protein
MVSLERYLCPGCTLVWERNLDGAWRYLAMLAVPRPDERSCPTCSAVMPMIWIEPLPLLADN